MRVIRYFYRRTIAPVNALVNPGAPVVARRLIEAAEGDMAAADALIAAGWTEVADVAALEAVV